MAVQQVAATLGVDSRHDEAAADVLRATQALQAEGLWRCNGPTLRSEYPIAGKGPDGELLIGSIDLVGVSDDMLTVIDFKTDHPPPGDVIRSHAKYAQQVRTYVRLLRDAGIVGQRTARCGLLFTADGLIRWVSPDAG
jgi:ATP-dependent helicase/nuclease subunit A